MYLKIETKKELVELVNTLNNAPENWLAIDTEFFRETTYYPVLSLIQIATSDQVWVIDVINCGDVTPLKIILENKKIKKIFHAGEQDWELLKRYTGAKTWPYVDIQYMAAFAKHGYGASLETIALEVLGMVVDKSQQKTNWLDRPLKDEQLTYAAKDAQLIAMIFPLLDQLISDLGRSSWIEEEMQTLLQRYENVNFDREWLKLCGNSNMKWPIPYYAYQLTKFREDFAKKLDVPRKRIIQDDVFEKVLQKKSIDCVENIKILPEVYDALKIFWQTLKEQDTNSVEERPWIEQMVTDYHKRFSKEHISQMKAWKKFTKKIAKELGISPFLFLNKKQIQKLADKDTSSITGWRHELLSKLGKI